METNYELADTLTAIMEAANGSWFTPSALARKAKATTGDTAATLIWMAAEKYIRTEGNGAWTKYSAR